MAPDTTDRLARADGEVARAAIAQISPPSYNSRMRGSGLLRNRAWLIAST